MVRSNRIKEYRFPDQTISAASSGLAIYSDEVINGEILEVEYKFNQGGSVAVSQSGTSREMWRRNSTSGASWGTSYPYVFSESTTGSIANANHVPQVVRAPIVLTTGSLVSGTNATLSVNVKYR